VSYDRIQPGRRTPASATARLVVLSAGSMASTELLLRCRDEYGSLPKVSGQLGYNWSSNGDFLTPGFYLKREVQPTQGPTITTAINFLDGSQGGQRFWIQDGGLPNLVANWITTAKAPDARVQGFSRSPPRRCASSGRWRTPCRGSRRGSTPATAGWCCAGPGGSRASTSSTSIGRWRSRRR
jgi:cholesterol oxidase